MPFHEHASVPPLLRQQFLERTPIGVDADKLGLDPIDCCLQFVDGNCSLVVADRLLLAARFVRMVTAPPLDARILRFAGTIVSLPKGIDYPMSRSYSACVPIQNQSTPSGIGRPTAR